MALKKTTILPDDASAAAVLTEILETVPAVLMLVRGVPTDAQIDLADKMAGGPSVFRRIVWAQNPAHVAPVVDALARASGITFDENTAALFISFNDVINGTLQTFADFTKAKISISFMKAQVDMESLHPLLQ